MVNHLTCVSMPYYDLIVIHAKLCMLKFSENSDIQYIEIENMFSERKIMRKHLLQIRQMRLKNYLLISFYKRVSNDSLTLLHKIDKTA